MAAKETVRLPNLVVSFLEERPHINTHYEAISQASKHWLNSMCDLDHRGKKVLTKGDFAYFCAIATPRARLDRFRLYCDWVNWVFPFDDLFDNGVLKDDMNGAKAVMENLIQSMCEEATPQTAFVKAHQDIWVRLQRDATEGVRQRFVEVIRNYCAAVLHQVQDCSESQIRKAEDMIVTRRDTIGVKVLYVFLEYAHELKIPDEVFDHPLIKEIETLAIDWILIQNDMLSYPTEEDEGVQHNLISAKRAEGMQAQEAFDYLGAMLEKIYKRFDCAIAELPSWGGAVDQEVLGYVEGVKKCVKANLDWSFHTERYFGPQKDEVRASGRVDVLKVPPYLSKL